jgi:hypothetical protein
MGEKMAACMIFMGKPKGKRPPRGHQVVGRILQKRMG